MKDTQNTTFDDAPYTDRSLSQLAQASTARDLADTAAGFVAVYPSNRQPVADAARFLRAAQELLDRAVIVAKEEGDSWEQIGADLGITKQSAHTRFKDAVTAWEEALKRPVVIEEAHGINGLETWVHNRMPAGTATPDETAAELDAWATAHAVAEGQPLMTESPVSSGLVREEPLMELMKLTRLSNAVRAEYLGPPPHLMAEIRERAAVLWDRIAAAADTARSRRESAGHAAEARQQAADYRTQDAHLRSIAKTQSPDQHRAEHAQRWPKDIYGPYRTFPDEATARDWCAHCNVWIGTPTEGTTS